MEQLFSKITPKEQTKLLKLLEANTVTYNKDTTILSNSKDNIIGVIISGYAKIIRTDYNGNTTIIEELSEGNVFGTLISSIHSSEYDIITKEKTTVILIDFEHIIKSEYYHINYYNQFVKNLLKITTDIIEEKNIRIEILTKKTIRDKLLAYFNIISTKHGSRNIYLPFSYTDLADYLAIDRSAMTRELKNLKEEGVITTKGRKITLLNKDSAFYI